MDLGLEVSDQGPESAIVHVTGTRSMAVPDDQVEELARAILEADGDELGPDELQMMLPFEEMAFSQSLPLDEEVTAVTEEGAWVVCGGLGGSVDEPGFDPTISREGVCGIVSPGELSALGALEFDSASGFETFCSYSTGDYEEYHQTTVEVSLGQEADLLTRAHGAERSPRWPAIGHRRPAPMGSPTSSSCRSTAMS